MAKHIMMSDSSSCEAEQYEELAKCGKGTKFSQMLLGELNLAELPGGLLFEDSAGAIFLAANKQVSKRTKHSIDLKHQFIRELMENINGHQQAQIHKIEMAMDTVDIGMKNAEVKLVVFLKHANELEEGMPMLRERTYGKNGMLG